MGGLTNLTLKELFSLIDYKISDRFNNFIFPRHLATDSRSVIEGGAFVALEGSKVDGHNFIAQAVQNGASLIIYKRGKAINIPDNIARVELEDPERDLAKAASLRLKAYPPKEIIAITGSVGKTSTRAALEKIMSLKFKTHSPEKSFNTLIGCTATILAMPSDTQALILEFGANKPGEIEELTNYFQPSTAILTSINPVHLEGFKTIEGVLNEKLKITSSKNIKRVIYNADNQKLREAMENKNNSFSVGCDTNFDYVIDFSDSLYELPALKFKISHDNKSADITAHIWGKHAAVPLSLALAAGVELGIDFDECAQALNNFRALSGRGRVIFLEGGKFLIDDAYNANPASMTASLKTFNDIACENKAVILGEMRELGANAVKFHEELEPLLKNIPNVILTGKIWREAFNKSEYNIFDTWQESLEAIKKINWTGLLIKGSNSIGLSNIVRVLS